MFFVAAKLIWFVIQPSTALILLLVAGIVAIGLGRPRAGMLIVMLGTTGLLVAGLLPLGVLMMLPLEDRFQRQEPDGPVAGIIVLGGGIDQSIGAARGVTTLTEAGAPLSGGAARLHRWHREPHAGRPDRIGRRPPLLRGNGHPGRPVDG